MHEQVPRARNHREEERGGRPHSHVAFDQDIGGMAVCCIVLQRRLDDVATCAQVGFLEPGDRVVVLETVLDDSHSPRHRTNKGWARHRPPHATDWHWSHRIEPLP